MLGGHDITYETSQILHPVSDDTNPVGTSWSNDIETTFIDLTDVDTTLFRRRLTMTCPLGREFSTSFLVIFTLVRTRAEQPGVSRIIVLERIWYLITNGGLSRSQTDRRRLFVTNRIMFQLSSLRAHESCLSQGVW